MPFQSKRQMRAAFGGHIPGISKEKAKEWAKETPDLKDLPDRAPAEKGQPTLLSKEAQTVNKRLLDAIDAAGVPIAEFPHGFRDDAAAAYAPKFIGPMQEYIRNHVLTQPGVDPSTVNNLKGFLHMRPGGVHFYDGLAGALHEDPGVVAHEFGHAVAEKKFPNAAKAETAARLLFGNKSTAPIAGFIAGASTGEGSSKTREIATPLLTAAATGLPLILTEGQAWYHGLGPLRQAGGDVAGYHKMNLDNLVRQAAPVMYRGALGYGAGRLTRAAVDTLRKPKQDAVEAKQAALAHSSDSGAGLSSKAVRRGQKVEREHTADPATAQQIAIDHLRERPDYYARLAEAEKQAAFSPTAIRALQHGGIGAGAGALIGAGAGAAGADPNQRGRGALKGALAGAGIGFAGGAGGSLLHNRISTPTATAPVAKGINAVNPTAPTMPAIGPRPYGPLPGAKFPQRTGAFNVTDPSELYHLEQQGWKLGPKDVLYPPGQNRFRTDALTNRFTEPPVKIAVNADFIRINAVQGLAKRGLPLDGKAQAEIANKAIRYVRAKAQSPEEARKARDALRETLGKFKGQVPKSRPKDYGAPRQGGAWAGVGRSSDLLDSAGARLALVLGNTGAELGKTYLSGKQDTESKTLKKQLRAAQRAEFTGAPVDTSADRAKHRAIFTGLSALQGGLSGGYAGGALGPLAFGADPNKAMATGALLGALGKGGFGYFNYGRKEEKLEELRGKIRKAQGLQKESADVSELEARLNQMQAEKAHEDRISAVANHFDHLGLGILASPYIADAAEKATRNLMLRGGKLGRVGAELHTGADAAKHFLHAHPLLVEGGGLALVAPGVTHRLAKAVDHFRPGSHQPMAPSVPEQPTAVSDMRAASSAAEKVGRLLAHPAPQEKVAINLPNTLAGAAGAAWKNKKTLAGIGAVGAVGAGLYGAKKGIDAAERAVTHQHGPARYVGVPPGMQPPAPAYMPIGS